MACTAEKRNDMIRFLEDKRPEEDSEFTAGEDAHSQSTEELTRQTQAQSHKTREVLVPNSSKAVHPQLIAVLGRQTGAHLYS